jgi:hypothetical protein
MATNATNATFIDSLLDNWVNKDGTSGTTGTTFAAAAADDTVATNIQTALKKIYLVFHYPQYTDSTATTDFSKLVPTEKDRVFNYVYNPDYTTATTTTGGSKVLLSTKGITKANMVTLKILLDSIVNATDAGGIKRILSDTAAADAVLTTDPTLGGNNSMIPKTSGGRNKNKSNKRIFRKIT